MVCKDDDKTKDQMSSTNNSEQLESIANNAAIIELKQGDTELLTNMSYLLNELKMRLIDDKKTGLIDSTLSATKISYLSIDDLLAGEDVELDVINKLCIYYGFKYQLIKLDS